MKGKIKDRLEWLGIVILFILVIGGIYLLWPATVLAILTFMPMVGLAAAKGLTWFLLFILLLSGTLSTIFNIIAAISKLYEPKLQLTFRSWLAWLLISLLLILAVLIVSSLTPIGPWIGFTL